MEEKEIIIAKNKKARYEYTLEDEFTAGIVLQGTEIKSIRNSKARITEAYCAISSGELWVRNMYIEEYAAGSYNNHLPKRERKLLVNKSELKKIVKKLKDNGVTCIPTLLFISARGKANLKISIASGKKLHDKREDLKRKDASRQIDRSESDRY